MVELRTPEQLPRTAIAQGSDLIVVQSPDGPVESIELSRIIGRLGPTDLVVERVTDLGLGYGPGTLAIVYADPNPDNLGYHVKTGALGAGGWTQSKVFGGAKGLKGDPGAQGGNVMAGPLFTDAWPAVGGTDMRRSAGYSVAGKGAAWYVRDGAATWSAKGTAIRNAALADFAANQAAFTAVWGGAFGAYSVANATAAVDSYLAATEGRFRKADVSGQYWTLSTDQLVNDFMFGAVRNSTYNPAAAWNLRWTGTVDRPAIQAMIDWSLYFGGTPSVHTGRGYALIDDTLHHGYGDQYVHGALIGSGSDFYGVNQVESRIVRNFVGKPALNLQGSRSVAVDKIGFNGVHEKYFSTNGFALPGAACVTDDTVLANWFDPTIQAALGRSVDSRYAPDAAITIDAYKGSRPVAGSYPDAAYPAWLGAASLTQWNKALGTDYVLGQNGLNFYGEINWIVNSPCSDDGDQNADFMTLGRLTGQYSKRMVSVGHTQSRCVSGALLSGGQVGQCIATTAHGKQQGQLDGSFHLHCSGMIMALAIGDTPLTIEDGSYFEGLYQVADLSASTGRYALRLSNCLVDLGLQGDTGRPIPSFAIAGANGSTEILGGGYANFSALFAVEGRLHREGRPHFDGRLFGSPAGAVAPYLAAIQNATGGGVVALGGLSGESAHYLRNIDTGVQAQSDDEQSGIRVVRDGMRTTSRAFGLPLDVQYGGRSSSAGSYGNALIVNPWAGQAYQRLSQGAFYGKPGQMGSQVITSTAAGYELAFTFSGSADNPQFHGGAAGDLIYDPDSKTFFAGRSFTRATGAAIWRAIAGIKKLAGNWTPINAFSATAGSALNAWNCRRYVPELPVIADFTNGSQALANVMAPDGSALNAATISQGDYADLDDKADGLNYVPNVQLTALNIAAKTATMTGGASRSVARYPIQRFVRTVANG